MYNTDRFVEFFFFFFLQSPHILWNIQLHESSLRPPECCGEPPTITTGTGSGMNSFDSLCPSAETKAYAIIQFDKSYVITSWLFEIKMFLD